MTKKDKNKIIDTTELEMHNDDAIDDITIENIEDNAPFEQKLKKVRDALKKCETEKKEYLDGWQRSKAEFINAKKRDEETRTSAIANAKEDIIFQILTVLDSFDMAFGDKESIKTLDTNWVSGVKNIQTQLFSILKDYGVEELDPQGGRFDPNLHDSIETRPTIDPKEDGKILEILQKGYSMDGKILRAVKVVVAQINSN